MSSNQFPENAIRYLHFKPGFFAYFYGMIVIRENEQVTGEFDSGKIQERRAVLPGAGEKFSPPSNLFYWARAWSEKGGLVDLHPHKGFEIISYIIKGEIEHFDTGQNTWIKLHAGDLQVIQSGKGIQHAERLLPGSEIFQIWFDPDLQKSLQKDAVYQDYKAASFPNEIHTGYEVQHIKEKEAPVTLDAKDVFIRLYTYQKGSFSFLVRDEAMCALFVLDGELKIAGHDCRKGDYILVESTDLVDLEIYAETRLFAIELPVDPGYPLYSKSFKVPS